MIRASLALLFGAFMTQTLDVSAQEPKTYRALPEAVSSFGAIASDGFVYLYGGHTGTSHNYSTATASGQFYRLDLKNPINWDVLPGGAQLQGMNLAAHKGKIYIAGGMQPRNAPGTPADNHSVADVACYDPATKKWSPMPALPEPRSSHDVVALDGKLYVVGGWWLKGKAQKPTWQRVSLVLDLAAAEPKWTSMHQPFERRALAAAAVDGKLYVLGGMNDQGVISTNVEIYDPKTERWSFGLPFPGEENNGFSPAACELAGKLYLSVANGRVYRLDANAWTDVGGVPDGRLVARLVPASSNRLLVLGGSTKNGNAAAIGVVDLK